MTSLREAAQQALEFIRAMNSHGWLLADYESDMERTVAGLEAALAQEPQDAELSAALGWPGGISTPVLDRAELLRMAAKLAQEQAKPVQEPVAWALQTGMRQGIKWNRKVEHGTPLYTVPPQRKPLTEEQDAELSAALGWPGGISEPVLDRGELLRMVATLAQEQAKPQSTPATPAWWRVGLTATLMREGVNKHRAREIADGYWEAYCEIGEQQ